MVSTLLHLSYSCAPQPTHAALVTHDPNRTSLPFNFGVDLIFAIALQDRVALAAQDYLSGAAASG